MSSTSLTPGLPSITDGQVVKDATLHILLAAVRVMSRSTGVLQVDSIHHRWRLLLKGGGIILMEEEGHAIQALVDKYANRKIKFARVPEWDQKQAVMPISYPFASQVFKRHPEETKDVLKDVVLENLLALHLEETFTFVWQPLDLNIELPVCQLAPLETTASGEARQWEQFQCVKHPFQQVQLLDAASLLARVGNDNFPLFAKVTTGQHRISEIADNFKQPIYRTALLLDKLAQRNIVSILPLPERPIEQLAPAPDLEGAAPEPNETASASNEPRVFVVDDSPVLLRQFRNLLSGWGYQVALTDDANKATDMLLEYMPKVVFVDINMPGLNGFELIKQIRREPKLQDLNLVLVTAENSMTNSFRAKWANCRFIGKPKTASETEKFRDELRNLLREVAPLSTDELV
ncbi:MAG: response regulator [Oscillatoriales cyanobacterium SM2_2_1]|nr:response regulator [Oscillatoriales cyanobacterium SM2_2_1]